MSFEFSSSSNEDCQKIGRDISSLGHPGNVYDSKGSSNMSPSPKANVKSKFNQQLPQQQQHHHHHHHQIQPKFRSKSFCQSSASPSPQHHQHNSQPQPQRRPSSFSSTSSPWFRRKSFLSSSMISNDKSSVYELSSYSYDQKIPNFTLSLKESQGFIFNQDLFASQYQQSRVVLQDDTQGVIIKDLRNERSLFDGREEGEDYGIETTDVFIDSDESDNEEVLAL